MCKCIHHLLLVVLTISTCCSYSHTHKLTHCQHLITVSAQNTTTTISAPNPAALSYLTRPTDVTVAVGEPAVFRCGVPEASPNVTFTFYRSHSNYILTCPYGHVEDIPQVRWSPPDSVFTLILTLFPLPLGNTTS